MYQLYRYTRRSPLDTTPPIKYGDVIHPGDKRLSATIRARFLESGTLIQLELPPLSVLPENWQERAKLLAAANIFTIGDLLAANEKELAKAIGKSGKLIKLWKTEVEQWLSPDTQPTNND